VNELNQSHKHSHFVVVFALWQDFLMSEPILSDAVQAMRARIPEIGRLLFDRQLTDAAGGNISARVGDLVCITPRYAGQKFQWRIAPEQVLVFDLQGNRVAGEGVISRESQVHLRMFNDFPDCGSVIHAHPRNVLVFCAARKPIPMLLEANLKFGDDIQVTEFAPAHSAELAAHVSAKIRGQEVRIRKQAAAVLAPWHGIFCVARDIDAAFDAVERIDVNARIVLMGSALGTVANDGFAAEQMALKVAMASA
jgi:L-fuculose-phosphate aldolase